MSKKPGNWIPPDSLLARAVRQFRAEGFSKTRLARELKINRRTVARLCATSVSAGVSVEGAQRAQ
jgi:DNA invertase Pin-like site-specific DNA recombinase